MKLPDQLRDLFYFHESARRGIIWLVMLVLASIAFRLSIPWFRYHERTDNLTLYQSLISSYQSEQDAEQYTADSLATEIKPITEAKGQTHIQPFDPDTATLKTWMSCGMNRRQASTVIKYLKSGGKLNTRKDLLKIRIIDTSTFVQVAPYLHLPDSVNTDDQFPLFTKKQASVHTTIDINKADTSTWKTLPGIGSYYARKIVEYRTRLGGFCSIDQIMEIKGFRPETFESVRDRLQLLPGSWSKIDINGFDETRFSHPYLSKTQIRTLAAWREKHGIYSSATQVRQAAVLSDAEMNKLIPYLPF